MLLLFVKMKTKGFEKGGFNGILSLSVGPVDQSLKVM